LVRQIPGPQVSLLLTKRLSLSSETDEVEVAYRLENLSEHTLKAFFAISFNFTVLGPGDSLVGLAFPDGRTVSLASGAIYPPTGEITVFNRRDHVDLKLVFSPEPARLVQYPVETISQSESGIDRTYQATCLMPVWPLELKGRSGMGLRLILSTDS
ncbi:MAG: alpha-amylase/4-alpha-glucanotransferase domain-containing protein, partial [Gemmatimonadota bacterium]|nr:alpha-amylase/4-alpha-glucanotransferase domain-containing protein [Gemmatimonadota bacterium]